MAKPSVHSAELIDQATIRSIRASKPRVDHPSRIFNPIFNFVVSFEQKFLLFLLMQCKFGSGVPSPPPWLVLPKVIP
jgi:hypothetical protein